MPEGEDEVSDVSFEPVDLDVSFNYYDSLSIFSSELVIYFRSFLLYGPKIIFLSI